MRKTFVICALAALASQAIGAPPQKQPAKKAIAPAAKKLPAFQFKGVTAGEPLDMSLLTGCSKSSSGQDYCYFRDKVVAGNEGTLAPAVYINNGKLESMLYVFENKGTEYLTLLSALVTKYGAPCKQETEEWANRAGAKLDNAVTTWCFATGKLKLTQLSSRVTYSDLSYEDEANRLPAPAAKVDF